jgi:hypothetical protein
MHILTELFQIVNRQSILLENFSNNNRKWEIVDIETEKTMIKEGYYHMHNTSTRRWNYYKMKTALKKGQDFIIETIIELNKKEDNYGHFGLLWGFDNKIDYVNRFTLSADGKRALIMHFEKDHHKIYHRFQNRKLPFINLKKPIQFSIIKLGEYLHFFINQRKIYLAHESLFANDNSYIGYYIEPGLSIKSNYLEVKKLSSRALDVVTGIQQLMSEVKHNNGMKNNIFK